MATRSDGDEDLRGRLPRLLDALGQGLLLAGVGLFTRAAAYAIEIETHAIEHRGLILPPQRSPRDGKSPATEHELVELFVLEQAGKAPRFVARPARGRAAPNRRREGRLTRPPPAFLRSACTVQVFISNG